MKRKMTIAISCAILCLSASPMATIYCASTNAGTAISDTATTENTASTTASTEDINIITDTENADGSEVIEAVNTRQSDETPCQISVTAIVPDNFGLSSYLTIMNDETGQQYNLPIYAANNYSQRCYVPAGTYIVIGSGVYDDYKMQYPFSVTSNTKAGDDLDTFTVDTDTNKTVDIEITLDNYDAIEAKINDNLAVSAADSASTAASTETVIEDDETKGDFEVTHTGNGTGTVVVTGEQTCEVNCVIKITGSGEPGTAKYICSLDGGNTFSDEVTMGISGIKKINAADITITCDGEFAAGDTYSFWAKDPDKVVTIKASGESQGISVDLVADDEKIYPYDIMVANDMTIIVRVIKGGVFYGSVEDAKFDNDPTSRAVIRISIDNGKTWTPEQYIPDDGIVSVTTSDGTDTGLKLIYTNDNNNKSAKFVEDDSFTCKTDVTNMDSVYAIIASVVVAVLAACYMAVVILRGKITKNDAYNINTYKSINLPDKPKKNKKSK